MSHIALCLVDDTPADPDDALGKLHAWLLGDDKLRGRVRLRAAPPPPGAMGTITDLIEVGLGPGGTATALVGAVIVWLRQRKSKLTIRLSRDGNSVDIAADRVRDLDPAAIQALTAELAATLTADPQRPES